MLANINWLFLHNIGFSHKIDSKVLVSIVTQSSIIYNVFRHTMLTQSYLFIMNCTRIYYIID